MRMLAHQPNQLGQLSMSQPNLQIDKEGHLETEQVQTEFNLIESSSMWSSWVNSTEFLANPPNN